MTNTNTSDKTRKLVVLSLLTAITFFLGLTPIGYIRIGALSITILCIPVIIGVIMEGLGVGLILGFVFGLTSMMQIFMGFSPLGTFMFNMGPIRTFITVFVPRLLVPVTAYYTHHTLRRSNKDKVKKSTYVATALVGSLTNTFLFLGFMYLLYIPEIEQMAQAFETTADRLLLVLGTIVLTNGIPEAIAAAVIVSLVGISLYYAFGKKEIVNDSDI